MISRIETSVDLKTECAQCSWILYGFKGQNWVSLIFQRFMKTKSNVSTQKEGLFTSLSLCITPLCCFVQSAACHTFCILVHATSRLRKFRWLGKLTVKDKPHAAVYQQYIHGDSCTASTYRTKLEAVLDRAVLDTRIFPKKKKLKWDQCLPRTRSQKCVAFKLDNSIYLDAIRTFHSCTGREYFHFH
jgi:hypothetical protein